MSKHEHIEYYAGEKQPDAEGWTYHTCDCGYQWRQRTVIEPVDNEVKDE